MENQKLILEEKQQNMLINNSRYENIGYKNDMEYIRESPLEVRNDITKARNTANRDTKIIASTGSSVSMINEKVSVKDTIKSEDHKKHGHISKITKKPSEKVIRDISKDISTRNHNRENTQQKGFTNSNQAGKSNRSSKTDLIKESESIEINTRNNLVDAPSRKLSTQIINSPMKTLNDVQKSRRRELYRLNSVLGISSELTDYDEPERENVGVQTIIKTKNSIQTSITLGRKTVKSGKARKAALKASKKTIKQSVKAAKRTAVATRKAVVVVIKAAKLLSNPVVLKGILIVAVVLVVLIAAIACVSSVVSVFSSLTFSSKASDLNDTNNLITELDADVFSEFNDVERNSRWILNDKFHYYTNWGTLKKAEPKSISICTDTTKIIAYLTCKYEDFTFELVKDEIKAIHSQLYKISYKEWEEQEKYSSTFIVPVINKEITTERTKTIKHLDSVLEGITFEEWMLYGKLDASQKDRYENTITTNGTLMLRSYGSPFEGTDWRKNISSRFGYRVDPVYGGRAFHNGVDIALPSGTLINSVSDGTVSVGYASNGYGNYVTVTTSSETKKVSFLYGHCNEILVSDGQQVKKGDKLATVGSTGKSTGSHLHLTYLIEGTAYNPEFYIE